MNNIDIDKDDSILIENTINSDTIIVSFGGVHSAMGMPVFEFFNIMKNRNYTKIFIKDNKQAWYHQGIKGTDNILSTAKKINEILEKTAINKTSNERKKIVFIGNSAGGYAAIVFGILLKVDRVLAFAPQTFLGKTDRFWKREKRWKDKIVNVYQSTNPKYFQNISHFMKQHSSNSTVVEVFFGLDSTLDRNHFNNISELPFIFHLYPYGKHYIIKELKKRGVLEKILNDL